MFTALGSTLDYQIYIFVFIIILIYWLATELIAFHFSYWIIKFDWQTIKVHLILICITRVCPYSEKIQLKVIKCVFSFFLSFSANRTIFSLTNQFSDDFCPSKARPLNSSMKKFRLNLVIFLTHWPAQHNFDTGRYL